ncbi:hypothetical protein EDC01DRAFT_636141 [Geopyxis carbonaria]|nr:hypothetical protein EDC01DRAFT_636141 [Geopyxis carbonaria]
MKESKNFNPTGAARIACEDLPKLEICLSQLRQVPTYSYSHCLWPSHIRPWENFSLEVMETACPILNLLDGKLQQLVAPDNSGDLSTQLKNAVWKPVEEMEKTLVSTRGHHNLPNRPAGKFVHAGTTSNDNRPSTPGIVKTSPFICMAHPLNLGTTDVGCQEFVSAIGLVENPWETGFLKEDAFATDGIQKQIELAKILGSLARAMDYARIRYGWVTNYNSTIFVQRKTARDFLVSRPVRWNHFFHPGIGVCGTVQPSLRMCFIALSEWTALKSNRLYPSTLGATLTYQPTFTQPKLLAKTTNIETNSTRKPLSKPNRWLTGVLRMPIRKMIEKASKLDDNIQPKFYSRITTLALVTEKDDAPVQLEIMKNTMRQRKGDGPMVVTAQADQLITMVTKMRIRSPNHDIVHETELRVFSLFNQSPEHGGNRFPQLHYLPSGSCDGTLVYEVSPGQDISVSALLLEMDAYAAKSISSQAKISSSFRGKEKIIKKQLTEAFAKLMNHGWVFEGNRPDPTSVRWDSVYEKLWIVDLDGLVDHIADPVMDSKIEAQEKDWETAYVLSLDRQECMARCRGLADAWWNDRVLKLV